METKNPTVNQRILAALLRERREMVRDVMELLKEMERVDARVESTLEEGRDK